jgi:hypothetical protein
LAGQVQISIIARKLRNVSENFLSAVSIAELPSEVSVPGTCDKRIAGLMKSVMKGIASLIRALYTPQFDATSLLDGRS